MKVKYTLFKQNTSYANIKPSQIHNKKNDIVHFTALNTNKLVQLSDFSDSMNMSKYDKLSQMLEIAGLGCPEQIILVPPKSIFKSGFLTGGDKVSNIFKLFLGDNESNREKSMLLEEYHRIQGKIDFLNKNHYLFNQVCDDKDAMKLKGYVAFKEEFTKFTSNFHSSNFDHGRRISLELLEPDLRSQYHKSGVKNGAREFFNYNCDFLNEVKNIWKNKLDTND